MPPVVGAFVEVHIRTADGLGIGKVVEVSDGTATVSYFDVPGAEPALTLTAPIASIQVVDLPKQTRVFYCDPTSGRWQAGRILDGEGALCLVAFPNGRTVNVPREELLLRWRKPVADPVEFLLRQVTETPLFGLSRSKFVRARLAQRSACHGIGALLSASIELADYQFNVVRTVLQDPIQRYLLADEVGLGKTIEAGLLIRQYTLDDSNARVLLIVPPTLVAQWRDELIRRFGLRDWLDDYLWVVSSDEIATIEQHIQTAGMVVVDEAHHLSRKHLGRSHPLFELLLRYAPGLKRFFLLSGTPVLADTEGFLRILHLLDPVVFPLDDLPGFEQRVNSRQLVAEIVAALQPENVLTMEDDLDLLVSNFPDDLALMRRVEVLRPIVQALPDEGDEAFRDALNDLRSLLAETYKLHRRVLRNRRKSVPWATPARRGLKTLTYSCHWRRELQRVTEELRLYLLHNAEQVLPSQTLFAFAVHPNTSQSLERALADEGVEDARALALAREVDELRRQSAESGARDQVALHGVRECLATPGVQVVVFCDESDEADRLTTVLSEDLRGVAGVVRHQAIQADREIADEIFEPWRRFLDDPKRYRVLVCDASAEEGLNLHGGNKVVFHYDLPASPNRIEQRLGRLDRFGAAEPILSVAPICESDATELEWVACLADGLEVFNVSVASLQYLVEKTLKSAVGEWFNEGVGGLRKWKQLLEGPTGAASRERRRIEQQDSLDAMGDSQNEEFDLLEEVDSEWHDWSQAFESYALQTLLFRRQPEEWNGNLIADDQVFRVNYAVGGQHRTLVSLPEFVDKFLGTIDTDAPNGGAASPMTYAYAYHRRTVLSKEGKSKGIRPLRFGDPLVESLAAFCQSDDRGRAFAMWRHRPNYVAQDASGCDLWFRFECLVEANVGKTESEIARAFSRKAERHFAPQLFTVWVSAAVGPVALPPPELLEDYQPVANSLGRDFNLNPLRWETLHRRVDTVPWLARWPELVSKASQEAKQWLLAHDLLRQQCAKSVASLRRQHLTRVTQLESRLTRLTGRAQLDAVCELDQEKIFFEGLTEAIENPAIYTDVVGAIFVSAKPPLAR
jgi:ATP-dependent helicase HepA